jgi:ParB family chromosome partitioning protein
MSVLRKEMAMADETRSRLGRGLASLIGDVGDENAKVERPRNQRRVPIEFIHANPNNPRRLFSETELSELADSIRERGIIQPIVVRPVRGKQDAYEIIAGERRWRAAQRAGLHDVPIVPLDVTDTEALEIAIIENVQRADLNAMEEAHGYQALADEHKRSQDEIAKIVGKSRSHIANTMRLLKLPPAVQQYVVAGDLSAGQARQLIGKPDALELARQIIDGKLPVREVEALMNMREGRTPKATKRRAKAVKDPDTVALEERLSNSLGLDVAIDHRSPGGTVHIRYSDLEQLDEIVKRLGGTN